MIALDVVFQYQLPVGIDVVDVAMANPEVGEVVLGQLFRKDAELRNEWPGIGGEVQEYKTFPQLDGDGIQGEWVAVQGGPGGHVGRGDEIAVQVVGPAVVAANEGLAPGLP